MEVNLLGEFFCPASDCSPVSSIVDSGFCFFDYNFYFRPIRFHGFFGKDPAFLNWVRDLFLYYWDKGKRA